MKILYEITYATMGKGGIQRDTKSVAQTLLNDVDLDLDFLLSPRSYVKNRRVKSVHSKWIAPEIGSSVRKNLGRNVIPRRLTQALILFQSFSIFRTIPKVKVDFEQTRIILEYLKLKIEIRRSSEVRIFLLWLSYLARFARPRILGTFKIKTLEYDIFLQQQIDPIRISKHTNHVIRLHDFLPISHPQYFDHTAVKTFTKSLRIMLRGPKKIWVMDSKQTAEDFKIRFGSDLNVYVIPCVVSANPKSLMKTNSRKNQICLVNTIEPRKRVNLAISGFMEAKSNKTISQDWQLVIVGREGWQEESLIYNLRNKIFGSDISFIENASDFELEKIYSESKIVLSASAAEGFGLPPLEGMAHGCLPIVSDIPQHRETVRENGFYFSGADPRNIAIKIGEAVDLLNHNELFIQTNLINYIQANYSEQVIASMWKDLFKFKGA